MQKYTNYISMVVSFIIIILGFKIVSGDEVFFKESSNIPLEKAIVTKVLREEHNSYEISSGDNVEEKSIIFEAKLLSGSEKKSIVLGKQTFSNLFEVKPSEVKVGDKVILVPDESSENGVVFVFTDYTRSDLLMKVTLIFCIAIIIFGKQQGFRTIISLILTCLYIFIVFIPSIINGYNIYITSVIASIFIIVMTLTIIYGIDRKSVVAAIGCFLGTFISGLLVVISDELFKLTGLINEESLYLLQLNTKVPIDLNAIIFASVTIGAIGAIMDVSVSIASSLFEVYENSNEITYKDLFNSGIIIGRDMIGTMTNTLILAYIGSSLSITLLMISYSSSLFDLFNKEFIVVELLQSIIGSFGILCTIPVTTYIAAKIYTKSRNKLTD